MSWQGMGLKSFKSALGAGAALLIVLGAAGAWAAAPTEQDIQKLISAGKLESALSDTDEALKSDKDNASLQFLKGIVKNQIIGNLCTCRQNLRQWDAGAKGGDKCLQTAYENRFFNESSHDRQPD